MFKEDEGELGVEDSPATNGLQLLPLKLQRHNIGIEECQSWPQLEITRMIKVRRRYLIFYENMKTCSFHRLWS